MPDLSALDNPVWHALDSLHKPLGSFEDGVARYHAEVSVFAAVETPGRLGNLARLASEGQVLGLISRPDAIATSIEGWQELAQFPVYQMICGNPVCGENPDFGRRLNENDAAAMLALADLTEPGPFAINTGQMGAYFGIDGETGLLSMAGERLKLPGWIEVSGVCSHPDARGKGYAYKLIVDVIRGIMKQGSSAFLHVRKGSPSEKTAVDLYQRLGFEHHQSMVVQILRKN